jgi:hypothetical protein
MANDADQLVIASKGSIAVAPVGTTLPDDPTESLNAAFVDLGYATEDGVTLTVSPDIAEFRAWQARQAVRRELNGQEIQVAFTLEQWNAENVTLALGGGEVEEVDPGVFKYTFPAGDDSLDERAIVISWADGDRSFRAAFERGNVTEAVETNLVRTNLALLPITFKVLEPDSGIPGYILSDDPNFGEAS